jgi:ubiquitin-conjugating enzyme E2 D
LDIKFPKDYPVISPIYFHSKLNPPIIKFQTKIYHPNVHGDGRLCLGILRDQWISSFTLENIFGVIQNILCEPDLNCVCEIGIAEKYEKDTDGFHKIAREWTKKFAS